MVARSKLHAHSACGGTDRISRAQLTAHQSEHNLGIFIPGYYTGSRELNRPNSTIIGIKVLAGWIGVWDSPKLFRDIARIAITAAIFPPLPSSHHKTDPQVHRFRKQSTGPNSNARPDGMAAAWLDAIMILADCYDYSGGTEGGKVRYALANVRHEGVTGKIRSTKKRPPQIGGSN